MVLPRTSLTTSSMRSARRPVWFVCVSMFVSCPVVMAKRRHTVGYACHVALPAFVAQAMRTTRLKSDDRYIKVQHLLADAQLRVERDGRLVAMVGLHIDHPRTALARDLTQTLNQAGGDSLPSVRPGDREVVDVDLAARAFQLVELVRHQSTQHVGAVGGREHDHVLLAQDLPAIGVAGRR